LKAGSELGGEDPVAAGLEAGGRGDKGGRREEIEGRRSAGCGLSEEIRTVAGAAAKGRLRSGGGGRAQRRRRRR
jgi:hypothetical protein